MTDTATKNENPSINPLKESALGLLYSCFGVFVSHWRLSVMKNIENQLIHRSILGKKTHDPTLKYRETNVHFSALK